MELSTNKEPKGRRDSLLQWTAADGVALVTPPARSRNLTRLSTTVAALLTGLVLFASPALAVPPPAGDTARPDFRPLGRLAAPTRTWRSHNEPSRLPFLGSISECRPDDRSLRSQAVS